MYIYVSIEQRWNVEQLEKTEEAGRRVWTSATPATMDFTCSKLRHEHHISGHLLVGM
jgi:hypothetical protein